jgi:hypothetical protein
MTTDQSFRTWTPEVYETLHNTLTQISEGAAVPLNQLAELLETCFPVFQNVLEIPSPSEADRNKLLSRTLPNKQD